MTGGTKGAKPKFIIYKIADNKKEVVVEDVSEDTDYEVFLQKLEAAKDSNGNPAPRYAVYDVEYDLGGGEGMRYIFTSCHPLECAWLTTLPPVEARSCSSLGCLPGLPLSYVSTRPR